MIYDISRPIESGMALWPGDTAFAVTPLQRLEDGAHINLSDIRLSLHAGTHADAPWHFLPEGSSIDAVDLSAYLGPARVVGIPKGREVPVDILRQWDWREIPRCLLKTGSAPDSRRFNESFMAISPEASHYLVDQGARLVGTDALSVDAFTSEDLPVHRIFGKGRVAILEGLQLAGVPEGEYELIALPLRLVGLDASPVRAILRPL
jgi:arylformamidase